MRATRLLPFVSALLALGVNRAWVHVIITHRIVWSDNAVWGDVTAASTA